MTDFNALPLAEKIKQAQAGDIVVTDSGARVPLDDTDSDGDFRLCVSSGSFDWIGSSSITDIIRPTARKVPEVVEWLRELAKSCEKSIKEAPDKHDTVFTTAGAMLLCEKLADHFERTP